MMGNVSTAPGSAVLQAMIAHWRSQPAEQLLLENVKFASDPEANRLVKEDLTAFLLAASIDRGGKAFYIWNTPYLLKKKWGHLDTRIIRAMDPAVLAADPVVVAVPSQITRLQIAKTLISVASVIEKDFGGDPNGFFTGTTDEIYEKLQRIFGVKTGIARMMLIQRLLFFGLVPEPGGSTMPKIDVHVERVFKRTGVVTQATDAQVATALKGCTAEEVGIVDQVAWIIGATVCTPKHPKHAACPLEAVCPKIGVNP
jgi:hypothetical protein